MRRISSCLLSALIVPVFCFPGRAGEPIDRELMEKARRLHDSAVVIDTHVDTPLMMAGRGLDICTLDDRGEVDLVRMGQGGLDAVFLAVFVSNEYDSLNPSKMALETIDVIHEQIGSCKQLAELAMTTGDIRRLHRAGKRAILIGMENGGPVEGSLAMLRTYYRLGVRYITLTHNSSNNICDSSTDVPFWGGLSPFGVEVVAEMNRLGMMIDVSHISDDAFFDVLEHSTAPVIASHSAVRALCDVPRNLSDEMLAALAAKGGVIQVVFYSGFLSKDFWDASAEVRERLQPEFDRIAVETGGKNDEYYARAMPLWRSEIPEAPEIDLLIDHIDHIVSVAGIDHVGLGSDYDGAGSFPKGLEDASGYPLITYHLLRRGYSEEDILKILGENTMRVFEKVEEAASR
ncbi:MAG TPA: dipeptidase [Candidatus Krumholzibacterium sp.]|nr:dipeptidase [Candidatus Krumholzibacterium sp.]